MLDPYTVPVQEQSEMRKTPSDVNGVFFVFEGMACAAKQISKHAQPFYRTVNTVSPRRFTR